MLSERLNDTLTYQILSTFGQMEFSAQQLAHLLEGSVEGTPDIKVHTLSKIEEGHVGSLTFLANPQYTPYIYKTEASIVIVNQSFKAEAAVQATLIRVPDAYQAFAKLLDLYNQMKHSKIGVEQPSFIDKTAHIGEGHYIGAFAYISSGVRIGKNVKIYPQVYIGENVVIGDNCILFPGVKIYADCKIGNHVTLHSGVVVGGDGFGFAPNGGSAYNKVAQIGNVIIHNHVEVGANTTIDRATLGSTVICDGVKLDNLIQIAHNVEIGENTVIAAQTGVAGSTKIGKNCMIGGQVGIIGHLKIGDGARIAAQSGIGSDVPANTTLQGSPAIDAGTYKKAYVYFRKLPELLKDFKSK
jgi:UDP-3-O-[3-hydroxymyristoyl] glucosamine N-acyltransferase